MARGEEVLGLKAEVGESVLELGDVANDESEHEGLGARHARTPGSIGEAQEGGPADCGALRGAPEAPLALRPSSLAKLRNPCSGAPQDSAIHTRAPRNPSGAPRSGPGASQSTLGSSAILGT
eukprot:11162450-Alexandrium_andersonii.AAC.1